MGRGGREPPINSHVYLDLKVGVLRRRRPTIPSPRPTAMPARELVVCMHACSPSHAIHRASEQGMANLAPQTELAGCPTVSAVWRWVRPLRHSGDFATTTFLALPSPCTECRGRPAPSLSCSSLMRFCLECFMHCILI